MPMVEKYQLSKIQNEKFLWIIWLASYALSKLKEWARLGTWWREGNFLPQMTSTMNITYVSTFTSHLMWLDLGGILYLTQPATLNAITHTISSDGQVGLMPKWVDILGLTREFVFNEALIFNKLEGYKQGMRSQVKGSIHP